MEFKVSCRVQTKSAAGIQQSLEIGVDHGFGGGFKGVRKLDPELPGRQRITLVGRNHRNRRGKIGFSTALGTLLEAVQCNS